MNGASSILASLNSIGSQYGNGGSIGSSLGEGINAGIAGWTQVIATTAALAVAGAVGAARNAAVINSPSKPMMEIGSALGEGLHVGLDGWSTTLAAKSGAIVNGMIGAAAFSNAINGAGRGLVTASPSGTRSGDTNLTLTVNFNGAQPDAQIVEKIKTAAVDAMAMALGHARAMQVGM